MKINEPDGITLAVNGYDFRTWQPDAILALLSELRITALELPYDMQSVPASQLAKLVLSQGIAISGIYTSSRYALAGDNSIDARRVVRECLELAVQSQCRSLMVYLGTSPELSHEEAIKRATDALNPVLEEVQGSGVRIVVENLFDIKGNDPRGHDLLRTADRIATLFRSVSSEGFGLNFDPCNFLIAGLTNRDIVNSVRQLEPWITYVHLKDAVRSRDPERARWPAGPVVHDEVGGDFEWAAIGHGDVDIAAVVAELINGGYRGYLTVEGMKQPLASTYQASLSAVRAYLASAQSTPQVRSSHTTKE